jgi:hypothetical protein
MQNAIPNLEPEVDSESSPIAQHKLEVVQYRDRDSLSENFNNELEAWARHALASNGFGDY